MSKHRDNIVSTNVNGRTGNFHRQSSSIRFLIFYVILIHHNRDSYKQTIFTIILQKSLKFLKKFTKIIHTTKNCCCFFFKRKHEKTFDSVNQSHLTSCWINEIHCVGYIYQWMRSPLIVNNMILFNVNMKFSLNFK